MYDISGLTSNCKEERYANKHNGRLKVNPIPNDPKPLKEPNKALKVFE